MHLTGLQIESSGFLCSDQHKWRMCASYYLKIRISLDDFHSSVIISLSFTSNLFAFQSSSDLLLLADALHSMLELANEEVDFQRGLGFRSLQVWHHDVCEKFAKMLHLRCLLLFILLLMKLQQLALQLTHLIKSFNYRYCCIFRSFDLRMVASIYNPRSVNALKLYLLYRPLPFSCSKVKNFDLRTADSSAVSSKM